MVVNKTIKNIEEFMNLLKTQEKISNSLYLSLKNDITLPIDLWKKINKAYKINQIINQKGGSQIVLNKFACGGGGCVYTIKNNGILINDVLLKLFHNQVLNQKHMIDNIDMVLKFIENHGNYFIEHGSTFRKFKIDALDTESIETYTIYGPFGYFVKKCDGDLEKLDFTEIPLKSMMDNISHTLLFMNKLGIIHGDIKFPNIMQNNIDGNIKTYIHDFDDLYFLNFMNILPRKDFFILPPTFSPMYVSPLYLLYRNSIKKNRLTDFDNNLVSCYMLTGILGGILPPQIKQCYNNIVTIRNDICRFILQIEKNIYNSPNNISPNNIPIKKGIDEYQQYLNLLQTNPKLENKKNDLVRFSDIYSLGTNCIVKSFVLLDQNKDKDVRILEEIKKKLYNIGLNYLYNYFTFKQNLIGGSIETLTYYKNTDQKQHFTRANLKTPILEKLYSQIKTGRTFNMDQKDYDIANNFKVTMDILDIDELFKAIQNKDIELAKSNIDIVQSSYNDNVLPNIIELDKHKLS